MAANIPIGLSANAPTFDLVGPTLDDDIRRLCARYGTEAVKEAVNRYAKPKRGRKPHKDWLELQSVIEADALDWLNGKDPFTLRSAYSIAKDFADNNPGHSRDATLNRIKRKLSKNRRWMVLYTATNLSFESHPYATHIRALEAFGKLESHPVWVSILNHVNSVLIDYEAKKGEAPPVHMSMKEVEKTTSKMLLTLKALDASAPVRGIGRFVLSGVT